MERREDKKKWDTHKINVFKTTTKKNNNKCDCAC